MSGERNHCECNNKNSSSNGELCLGEKTPVTSSIQEEGQGQSVISHRQRQWGLVWKKTSHFCSYYTEYGGRLIHTVWPWKLFNLTCWFQLKHALIWKHFLCFQVTVPPRQARRCTSELNESQWTASLIGALRAKRCQLVGGAYLWLNPVCEWDANNWSACHKGCR